MAPHCTIGETTRRTIGRLQCGIAVALQMILNRRLGRDIDPWLTSTWGAGTAALLLSPLLPYAWTSLDLMQILLLLPLCTLAAISQIRGQRRRAPQGIGLEPRTAHPRARQKFEILRDAPSKRNPWFTSAGSTNVIASPVMKKPSSSKLSRVRSGSLK